MRLIAIPLAAIAMLIFAQFAVAQNRTHDVVFAPGESSDHISGALRGEGVVHYRLDATMGQQMVVHLGSDRPATYFDITHRGMTQPLFVGAEEGDTFRGRLPRDGTWVITVYQLGRAAANNQHTNFEIDVSITTPRNHPHGEAAHHRNTGATVVAGNLPHGDLLNIRRWPSGDSEIVYRAHPGRRFNLGECRAPHGTEWCEVTARNDGSIYGWAARRYLIAN